MGGLDKFSFYVSGTYSYSWSLVCVFIPATTANDLRVRRTNALQPCVFLSNVVSTRNVTSMLNLSLKLAKYK